MHAAVVDTDVVSFQFKRDSRAELYEPHLQDRQCVISFATLAELDQWASLRQWGEARRSRLEVHLRDFIVSYANRLLCRWWAEVSIRSHKAGRPILAHDAWIAATALAMDAPLVTNNPRDFAGVSGLRVLNVPTK